MSGLVKVRLIEGLTISIGGIDVWRRPAGLVMELPAADAEMMIRNKSAEPVTEPLLPHLFAKKPQSV
jgi:hypothetical protein